MDDLEAPSCAICYAPTELDCACESERLHIAVKQAEQRAMDEKLAEIRSASRPSGIPLLIEYQRLGYQPCARAHPQGFRELDIDTEASPLRIPRLITELRYLHALLRAATHLAHVPRYFTITNLRSEYGIEAGHRCRLACIGPTLSGSAGLLLWSRPIETTKRTVTRGCPASICGGWLCRQRV
jgi:hypothetical protein